MNMTNLPHGEEDANDDEGGDGVGAVEPGWQFNRLWSFFGRGFYY